MPTFRHLSIVIALLTLGSFACGVKRPPLPPQDVPGELERET